MTLPERKYSSGKGYRFGFQGQETDDEVNGDGNSIYFKYRVHDPRIGRFLSVDPLERSFPFNSQYAFAENRVIDRIELEGAESDLPPYFYDRAKDYETQYDLYNHYGQFGSTVYADGFWHHFRQDGQALYYDRECQEWKEFTPPALDAYYEANGYIPTQKEVEGLRRVYYNLKTNHINRDDKLEYERYILTGHISAPRSGDEADKFYRSAYDIDPKMRRFWMSAGLAVQVGSMGEGTFGGKLRANRYGGYGDGVYTPVGRNINQLRITKNAIGDEGYGYMEMKIKSKQTGETITIHGITQLKGKDLHIQLSIEGKGGMNYGDHSWKNTAYSELLSSRGDLRSWGQSQGYESITISGIRDIDSSSGLPGKVIDNLKLY